MLVQDVLLGIRYELGDMQQEVYSDHILLNALNSISRMVNIHLCNISNDLVTTSAILDTSVTGYAPLPSDYQGVTSVQDKQMSYLIPRTDEPDSDIYTYKIWNSNLYAVNTPITVIYKKSFPTLVNMTDTIPFPILFTELLKKYTKIYLQNQETSADSTIMEPMADEVFHLVAGRNYTKLWRKMPFYL
jgi:hypothetical protein